MKKAFIGSRLRQLRRELGLTQVAMAESLGISASYVNMLEKNQRSLSVPVLMALSSQYGIDWQDVVPNNTSSLLSDLRTAIQDPLFEDQKPDLEVPMELQDLLDMMLEKIPEDRPESCDAILERLRGPVRAALSKR